MLMWTETPHKTDAETDTASESNHRANERISLHCPVWLSQASAAGTARSTWFGARSKDDGRLMLMARNWSLVMNQNLLLAQGMVSMEVKLILYSVTWRSVGLEALRRSVKTTRLRLHSRAAIADARAACGSRGSRVASNTKIESPLVTCNPQ
jgi:hypothetical protein